MSPRIPRIQSPRLILALLTALWLLNNLDRYVLAAVIATAKADLSLSNFVAGLLPSVFLIGYFATSPVFGVLGDRDRALPAADATSAGARERRSALRNALMGAGVALWSAATIASGLAAGALSMVASRAVVGVGEASYGTLAPPLIDEIAPPARKSGWMAIYCAASPVGAALGYLLGGAVLHSHGWRAAFFVAGVPGLVLAGLCLLLKVTREGEGAAAEHVALVRTASSASGSPGAKSERKGRVAAMLLAIGLYRTALLGYCAYTFAIGGFSYWAPNYLHERYSMDAARASFVFGLVTVVGGAVGTLLGGLLADREVRRERRRQTATIGPAAAAEDRAVDDAIARANVRVCAGACAVGTPLALLAICAPSATLFFAIALPCQVAMFVLSGPINVALLRSAPLALRVSAMGVCIFGIHAFGDLWSTPLIGLIADHAPMQTAMYAVPAAFLVAAFVWWRSALASPRLT